MPLVGKRGWTQWNWATCVHMDKSHKYLEGRKETAEKQIVYESIKG